MKKTRQQYIAALKSSLDGLEADLARWELEAGDLRDEARTRRHQALEAVHARREDLRYQLKLLQAAAGEAWSDVAQAAEDAARQMHDAVAKARTHFTAR